jgi:hypothetical protein
LGEEQPDLFSNDLIQEAAESNATTTSDTTSRCRLSRNMSG